MSLPPYVSRELVAARLPLIFPEATDQRPRCINNAAATAVFCALYIGAVEGSGVEMAPSHAYRMNDVQAGRKAEGDRIAFRDAIASKKYTPPSEPWFKDNTRESIRDEALRDGLVYIGAVLKNPDVPTTSDKGRYSLKNDFAALFDPSLSGDHLEKAIESFQKKHLAAEVQTRMRIRRSGASRSSAGVPVKLPNGQTHTLEPGPSSVIAKDVIEVFAMTFLHEPAVLWLSESGTKVIAHHQELANDIKLVIEPQTYLPDLILADLCDDQFLLVFIEIVATDGPINRDRQQALYHLAASTGISRSQIAFVTAYEDRSAPAFKKTVDSLAWGTAAWFRTEPGNILNLATGTTESHLFHLRRNA